MRSFRTARMVQHWQPHGRRLAFSMFTIAVFAAATADAQVPYIRIAKTGDPVPNEPGTTLDVVGGVAIDDSGHVLFRASVDGDGINGLNNGRILFGRPQHLRSVAASGPAPQFGDDARLFLSPGPDLSTTGQVTYEALVVGDGITIDGELVYSGPPANPSLAMRSGQTPPGVESGLYIDFLNASGGAGDALVVTGNLVPIGDDDNVVARAIWAGSPDDLQLVARTGSPAPGVPTGVTFTTASVLAPSLTINQRGAVAFPAFIEGTGIDQTNNAGIWAGTGNDLSLVMRAGDPAPGTGPRVNFVGRPEYAIINGNDRVMFPAFLTGNGIDTSNDFGLWAGDTNGTTTLLAREGDEVPLLGSEFAVTNVYPYIQSDDNRIAMVTSFDGPGVTPDNDEAIFWGEAGDWEILFREGEQAPGLPPGVIFDFDVDIPKIAIRETGAAAMILGLDGPGVTDADDRALFWRQSESDPWTLLAREGQLFDGNTIMDGGLFIEVGGGGAGGSQSLTDDGLLAFRVRSDGDLTAIYLVPAPAPFWLLIATLAIVRRFRHS